MTAPADIAASKQVAEDYHLKMAEKAKADEEHSRKTTETAAKKVVEAGRKKEKAAEREEKERREQEAEMANRLSERAKGFGVTVEDYRLLIKKRPMPDRLESTRKRAVFRDGGGLLIAKD